MADSNSTIESLNIKIGVNADNVLNTLNNINSLFQTITASANVATQAVNQLAVALLNLNNAKDSVKITPEKIIPTSVDSSNPESVKVEAEKKATKKNGKGVVFDGGDVLLDDLNRPNPGTTPSDVDVNRDAGRGVTPSSSTRRIVGQRLDYQTRKWVNRIKRYLMPLVAAFSVRALWKGFMDTTKMLESYSDKLNMNAQDLDKWSKANAYAGGSAKGFLDAMTKWTQTTGKSGDEFIEMLLHINELSEEEQKNFLKTNQLTKEQVALFLQSDADIVKTLQDIKDITYTDKDIQKQKEFNIAWQQFKIQAQGLGDILIRMILPVMTGINRMVTSFIKTLNEHKGVLLTIGSLLAFAFGNVLVVQMIKGVGLGAKMVAVFKALTLGVGGFSKALLASPITWYIAAIAGLVLLLEDIYVFATGGKSFTGKVLSEYLGMTTEEIDEIRSELKTVIDLGKQFVKVLINGLKALLHWAISKHLQAIIASLRFIVGSILMLIVAVMRITDKLISLGTDLGEAVFDIINSDDPLYGLKAAFREFWSWLEVKAKEFWDSFKSYGREVLQYITPEFLKGANADGTEKTWRDYTGDISKFGYKYGNPIGWIYSALKASREATDKIIQNNNITVNGATDPKATASAIEGKTADMSNNLKAVTTGVN